MKLHDALMKPDDFFVMEILANVTFQILTKSRQAFLRYELSIIDFIFPFFFFSQRCEKYSNCLEIRYMYMQKGGIRVHSDIKYGYNTINS